MVCDHCSSRLVYTEELEADLQEERKRAERAESALTTLRVEHARVAAALAAVASKFGPRAHHYGCECTGFDRDGDLTCAQVVAMVRASLTPGAPR